ncbi:ABC transporter substrate-binding protein [Chelativorans sp. AA-79]|uniref:ABC transporter substrate-binding protein n=1 Tax=Chelativorans sp. AA-79 TaxID=3028735 RepID=UPI0023F8AA26|nr:ABC transporter substrate-binding protein [Chelativorans sp. AA-79]WEX09676.1 ABC transporter substrate-binding protein [Chelativorans sp. AA-79]
MKKILPLDRRQFLHRATLLGAAVGTGIGFQSGPALAQSARGGVLRVSVDQAPARLNPLQHRVNPEYLLGELLYSGLTRLGRDMQAEPDLAESWEANETLDTWTFRLRQGVTFHDGTPFSASDVVATFEAILDPATGSPARTNIGPVKTVSAADDLTVVFHLSSPYADLPVALAYTDAKIVPAAIVESGLERLDSEAVGTGPFKLVSYEPSRLTVVERNPDYYDPERPYLDRVDVVVYPDTTAEAAALISGDTDLMLIVPPSDFERVGGTTGITPLRIPSGQFLNVILGCDEKPFDDPRVRKALSLSIDREALVELVAEGYGTVGNDTPINSAYPFFADLPAKTPDYEAARALLAEAGYPDGLSLELIASDRPGTRTQLAVALRELAAPAGFRIEVQTLAHATYLDQVWLKGPFYVGFYNMQPTVDGIMSLLYTSDAAWNETKWNNAEFDRLIAGARGTIDETRRAELYAQAQQLMHDEVPTIIPVFFDLLGAKRDYVENFELHPRGAVFRLDHVSLGEGKPQRG